MGRDGFKMTDEKLGGKLSVAVGHGPFLEPAARLVASLGSSPAFPPLPRAPWQDTSPPRCKENKGEKKPTTQHEIRVTSLSIL